MKLKNIIMAVIGIEIMGFGCGMLIKNGLGADTFNCLITGIANTLNLSIGRTTTLFNIAAVVFIFLTNKKMIGIATILSVFLIQYPIDFALDVCSTAKTILMGVFGVIFSAYIFTFGSSLIICSNCGSSVYDGFVLSLSNITKREFVVIKYISDFACVTIGCLLGGKIGIATIMCLFLVGILMKFHIGFINRYLLKTK